MKYSFHPGAKMELNEAADFYEDRQKGLGMEFIKDNDDYVKSHKFSTSRKKDGIQ